MCGNRPRLASSPRADGQARVARGRGCGVRVARGVAVRAGRGVRLADRVDVAVLTRVGREGWVGVAVLLFVLVGVGVLVLTRVGTGVFVFVRVAVEVLAGVRVGVALAGGG